MQITFSEELEKVVEFAREEAMRTGYYDICTEHLMLGMLRHADNLACDVLGAEGLDLDHLKRRIDAQILKGESIPFAEIDEVRFSREAQNALSLAIVEASLQGEEEADSADLLLALTRCEDSSCRNILNASGVDRSRIIFRLSTARPARQEQQSPAEGISMSDYQNALIFGFAKLSKNIGDETNTPS